MQVGFAQGVKYNTQDPVAGGSFAGLTRGDMTSTVIGAASGGLAGYFAAKVAK